MNIIENIIDSARFVKEFACCNTFSFILVIAMFAILQLPLILSAQLNSMPIAILIALFVLSIAIVLLTNGFAIRVYQNEDIKFHHLGKLFAEGFVSLLVYGVYCLIPIVIIFGLHFLVVLIIGLINISLLKSMVIGISIAFIILGVIIGFLSSMVATMALVHYSKMNRILSSFRILDVIRVIKEMGPIKTIIPYLVGIVIYLVLYLLILIIPYIGIYLCIVVVPLLYLWLARFIGGIYERNF